MSLRSDGTYRCDRCGADVGNAAVTECAIVTDLEDGGHVQWHLCRQPQKGAPNGCAAHVLGRDALANYLKQQQTVSTGRFRTALTGKRNERNGFQ